MNHTNRLLLPAPHDLLSDGCPPLSFARPLPPADVHKAAAAEVLLTDARPLGENRFAVAALWPRNTFLAHRATSSPCDPLLAAETIRQSAIHLSHTFCDVPIGHHFVLSGLDLDLDLPVWDSGPLPVVLDVTSTKTTTNPRRMARALNADVYVAGLHRGRCAIRFEVLAPRRYAMIRDRARQAERPAQQAAAGAATALPPETVGFHDDLHVLLATAQGLPDTAWQLRLRRDHPVLFDHESDHISGMALLEACRQAATALTPPAPGAFGPRQVALTAVASSYQAFGELDSPVTITTLPAAHGHSPDSGTRTLQLTARQGSRTLITATVTTTTTAGTGSPGPTVPHHGDQTKAVAS
ncbi:ScbA/BarX family gamma-butyrolactone biosynthesis protein [Streptomyces rubrogriseus]|uniref:Lactone biosynthesis protein, mmfl n=1 Tax=Streptomyces rubrogriseus TaxID=194673 RepID=A0A6G3TC46_9ACTN|nr:ScbA/BarX family gamma-butyrolactone biosynthesis protein [Streptomyces rubrogriseus]NEC33591.1 lactone biosynthesis protein, mmfl [Streptomyces rubrogriseus]